jgi:serine phosphatase RsbU (regulator of sigma subunit)
MTMTVTAVLEGIMESKNAVDPARILSELRLVFAGGKIDLWVQETGLIREVSGDRKSLGYGSSPAELVFQNHEVRLMPGQTFYLFSDGVLDQSGGDKGFGLGTRRLKEALLSWAHLPLADIGPQLESLLSTYQGSYPQRDDLTAFGFQLHLAKDIAAADTVLGD